MDTDYIAGPNCLNSKTSGVVSTRNLLHKSTAAASGLSMTAVSSKAPTLASPPTMPRAVLAHNRHLFQQHAIKH